MKITQKEFGEIIGIRQAKVSRLLNGYLGDFSIDVLIDYLQCFNKHVQITITSTNCAPNHREF